MHMKLNLHRKLLFTATLFVALNVVGQPVLDAVETFVQHPHQCAIYLGGPDRAGDGTDRQYGVALAAAVSSLGASAEAALSQIRTACLTRPTMSKVQERPTSPTSP
jgi:hypothetical protein